MVGTVLGHFRIERKLGAGGMGEVYLAHDLELDRRVALKFIHPELSSDPEARARFQREARALAALDHPGVGAVHGVEEADGRLFLVLSYIEGRSLETLLAEGPLSPARARVLLPRIAEGLAAAHRAGIVHRDVKSGNVMVTGDDRPKLVDFGIARRGAETRLTQTGVYSGTPGSTAPEVFHGQPADARSDVFSLGVVLYEALTGRRPFERDHPAATLHAVLNEAPEPFSRTLPPESLALEPVVLRCLEKDPARRWPDAGAVAEALEEPSARLAAPRRVAWGSGAPWLRWVVAGAVLAALLLAGVWLVTRWQRPAASGRAGGAAKRSVAVLEFENLTGDPALDWMGKGIAELLGSALVSSPQLDVFDAQRLGELEATEHQGAGPAAPTNAFLARHKIGRAIGGSILRSGGALRIQGRIVDTADGRPVHSYSVDAPADSGLFVLAGRLVPDLQVALEVNLTGNREAEGWLREITTTSADSYRLYLSGHQALLASHWREAAAAYEKALDIDSTFIAARTELSGAYWNLGDDAKLQLTRAAMRRLRGRASHREQLRIDLLEAVVTGDPPSLIRAALELVQLYPENRFYTYLLGRGYYTAHQFQRCLDTLRPLVEQRYDWAWTYVLSARSALQLGDLASARRLFELGFEISQAEPEYTYAYVKFLREHGEASRIRAVVTRALQSPALSESPVGEGELRLELARDLAAGGDVSRARAELGRASALIPKDDEARPEADSLLRRLGMR